MKGILILFACIIGNTRGITVCEEICNMMKIVAESCPQFCGDAEKFQRCLVVCHRKKNQCLHECLTMGLNGDFSEI